jgi:hypothetical protein
MGAVFAASAKEACPCGISGPRGIRICLTIPDRFCTIVMPLPQNRRANDLKELFVGNMQARVGLYLVKRNPFGGAII